MKAYGIIQYHENILFQNEEAPQMEEVRGEDAESVRSIHLTFKNEASAAGSSSSSEAGDDDGESESESVPEKRMSYTTSKCTQL